MASCDFELDPTTSKMLRRSLPEKVAWIQRDHWVNTPSTRAIHQWMEYLLKSERRRRPNCMEFVAPPGMGKTAILDLFTSLHPVEHEPFGERLKRPLLAINASVGDAGVNGLRTAILRAAWPEARDFRGRCSQALCDRTLRDQGVRELLVDETGELLKCGPATQEKVLSELKRIGSDLRINIVCASVEGLDHALALDGQLHSRFKRHFRIAPWTESQDFRNFLFGLEMYLPFPRRSDLDRRQMVRWFLLHCKGNIEEITDMIRIAALHAFDRGGECVEMSDFNMALESEMPPRCGLGHSSAA